VPAPPSTALPAGADLARRRFFRQFATDVFHTAATVVGAATAIQRSTAEAASAILHGVDEETLVIGAAARDASARSSLSSASAAYPMTPPTTWHPPGTMGVADIPLAVTQGVSDASADGSTSVFGQARPAVGYHSALRVEGDRIVLVDQRRLPFAIVEVQCRTAIEVANEIGERIIVGPVVGQAAALGLAASADRVRASRPYARRAILRAAEATLRSARPTSRPLRAALERVMARCEAIGEFDEDGDRIADAMQDEANAIVFEANDDHGRIADAAATRIPRRTDRPTGILTLGSTGAMAGGQFGTAQGAIQVAVSAGLDVHVYVLEGRPTLDGARVTTWELAQAGIPHTLLPDAAAGAVLQDGLIDVVLVGAEAIAHNGDLANDAGTYPVAALAGRHGVPVIVCAPLAALDRSAPDGRWLAKAERPQREVVELTGLPVALSETPALNPVVDVTPAGLVTAYATEEGLLEGSFAQQFEAALQRRARRLSRALAATAAEPDAATALDPTVVIAAGNGTGA